MIASLGSRLREAAREKFSPLDDDVAECSGLTDIKLAQFIEYKVTRRVESGARNNISTPGRNVNSYLCV